jgi:DNA-binding MarR family transcriptional regulator
MLLNRSNLGFLLAKASQRWNELLLEHFLAAGFPEVRPAYGSVLVPLYEEDGLRMGELARRARLSKQTMTTLVRLVERAGLIRREPDPGDGRAARVFLEPRGRDFQPVAAGVVTALERRVADAVGAAEAERLRARLTEVMEL